MSDPDPVDRALERSILDLLAVRGPAKTICVSEAARAVHAARGGEGEGWRELMEPARQAAGRLVETGEVVITQRGTLVDLETVSGPIRVGLRQPGV
ncbi:hypothetical protein ABIE44_001491 [Marmoricola sp. OAE513]|uniref:DUF3253 domain-containing protein n=1 Tax=Marmoricola sp. OAE513 TaxID=2817894 RepID=UPI001AE29388